jgi:hypothetical protein
LNKTGIFFATRFLSKNPAELREGHICASAARHPADGRVYGMFAVRRPVIGGPTTCTGSRHPFSTRRCFYYTCRAHVTQAATTNRHGCCKVQPIPCHYDLDTNTSCL